MWIKDDRTFTLQQYTPPVPGTYSGTINSKSGKGDISLVARSNIIRNCLDPDWLTVKIPLDRSVDFQNRSRCKSHARGAAFNFPARYCDGVPLCCSARPARAMLCGRDARRSGDRRSEAAPLPRALRRFPRRGRARANRRLGVTPSAQSAGCRAARAASPLRTVGERGERAMATRDGVGGREGAGRQAVRRGGRGVCGPRVEARPDRRWPARTGGKTERASKGWREEGGSEGSGGREEGRTLASGWAAQSVS